MLTSARAACGRRISIIALAALALGMLSASVARAQIGPGQGVPSRAYLATLPLYYDGDYQAALAAFVNESRSGIKTSNSQWIDAICYLTMAGETYYELGQLPAALDSYSAALKLYVAYSDWMLRVQFPPNIVAAGVGAIRATPWGQSKRGAQVGQFSETFMMGQGQLDQTAVLRQGGVIQSPVLFACHVAEIVRCTCLSIRRRRELLGPISKHDPLTNSVLDVLSRRPGPPNHWTEAWVGVQLGCAYAAAGNSAQATTVLTRALVVQGEYDHPLTSTALVELGRLALEAGDLPKAGTFFEEATYAAVNFGVQNLGNLEEGFRLGALVHLLLNQKTPYPPLAPAIAWARAQGYRQLQASLLAAAAENMVVLGQTGEAANLLSSVRGVVARSDIMSSQGGARLNHVTAMVSYQSSGAAGVAAGDQAMEAALAFMRSGSLWLFQIGVADSRYTSGTFSDRLGLVLYETLLRDPTPGDWATGPLESLAVLSTPHLGAIEHWFEAALKSTKDNELALEIADRARRHRYFSTLPLGGRLLALRWILDGPAEPLGQRGLLQRQDLLARYPRFQQLSQESAKVRAALADLPPMGEAAAGRGRQAGLLEQLGSISDEQELILREMAVRREASDLVFPPLRKTKDVQQALSEGQVLLSFFATSRNMYAFLYSREKYAAWHINSPVQLQKNIVSLLRELGNFDQNHELTTNDLAKTHWRSLAAKVTSLLLEKSNVDLAGRFDEIVIVPDGILWYLPFELLNVGEKDHEQLLISHARVRYAPTVGLALPTTDAQRPQPNVGVLLGKMFPQDDDSVAATAFEQLSRSVTGAVALPRPLPAPANVYRMLLDTLVVLDDIRPANGPYDWSPTQTDKGKSGASLASWLALPWGGPQVVILPGFHTMAESGLRKGTAAGNDLFLTLCALLSSGTRTVLISRWRVGGQTSFDLVREFAQELPHASAAEAWQRSVQIAGDTPLELEHEPRIKRTSGTSDAFKAVHPFFWAGYMLVDAGTSKALAADAEGPIDSGPVKGVPAAQPANPVRGPMPAAPLPAAQNPPGGPGGDDAAAAEPRAKKGKSAPRPSVKKPPAPRRPKSVPAETTE
jgi:tetratricopeptide (TPR) repeat protein